MYIQCSIKTSHNHPTDSGSMDKDSHFLPFSSSHFSIPFIVHSYPSNWKNPIHMIPFISHSYPIHIPFIFHSYPIHIPFISHSYPIHIPFISHYITTIIPLNSMNIINNLVGGLEHGFYFPFHIWDVILPIDELIFFKMFFFNHQPVIVGQPVISSIDELSSIILIIFHPIHWLSDYYEYHQSYPLVNVNITIEHHHAIFMGKLTRFRLGHFQVRKL